MTKGEGVVFITVTAIVFLTLMIPPAVGLADNGDFYKLLSKFGLDHSAQAREDRYFAYVDMRYVPDPAGSAQYQQVWGKTLVSSEILFIAPAIWLCRVLTGGTTFHLQFVGAIHGLVFLAGVWLLLRNSRELSPPARIIGAALSLVMFADVAYLCYFNSAYTETSSYLFLLLLIASALPLMLGNSKAPVWMGLYLLFSVLFCCSRYPNVAMFPLLALFGFVLAFRSRSLAAGAVAAGATVLGVVLGLQFYRTVPPAYTDFGIYNHFFNGLLRFSPDGKGDLQEFGLDPSFAVYANTTYFQPESLVYRAEPYREFQSKVTTQTVAGFYLTHPARLFSALSRAVSEGFSLRPKPYGNYEKPAGLAPGAISQGFALWSSFREALPKSIWLVLLVLGASVLGAVWPRRNAGIMLFRLLMAALCLMQLGMIGCASEPSDIIRHLFLFNLLFDLTLLLGVVQGICFTGQRWLSSPAEAED